MKHPNNSALGRRDFLRVLAAGAGAGVAARSAAPLATDAVAAESQHEKRQARYKETEHVKTYYKVNRYPS
jgi:H+/Cl- antiporter ClcA